MLAFTNNSSPLFIIGTVGISMFGDVRIGIILFITHILSCLSVGLILGFFSKFNSHTRSYITTNYKKSVKLSNLGTILGTSISTAISNVLLVGGFVVLFSIIISIINNLNIIFYINILLDYLHISTKYSSAIFTGLIELTNGINLVTSINERYLSIQIIIVSFLLGCAGLSIFLQIFSIASSNNLSMKQYIIGKLLQGCFAAFYTYIILYSCNFFYFDLL